MLKGLRLRLTLICVLMTGAVFAVLMLLMAVNSERQYSQMNELIFQDRVNTVINRLQTEDAIGTDWLAETEFTQKCIIALESNGAALRFQGAWKPATDRDRLIQAARDYAREKERLNYSIPPLNITKPTQAQFRVTGERGDAYRSAVVLIPARENWFSLTMLADMSGELLHIRRQRFFEAAVSLAALITLCLLGWLFTGSAIKPTAESIARQREFVAAASHELRSPLAVIGSTASAIRVAPGRMDELTRSIERECGRLGRLVSDLLLLANTDTAAWRLNMAAVGVEAALVNAVEKYRALAAANGFTLTLSLPDELLPAIQGDAERLEQMFSILIDNAVSHSGKGGPIQVRASQTARHITVEVIDHGMGIPREAQPKIFERFYRQDKARSGKNHFGLGLSIVKELARLHGGTIELRDTEGGGCTFRLTFPKEKTARVVDTG